MPASRKPRPKERRSVDNELYQRRAAAAGIVMVSVRVPSIRVPEIKAIALEWRREAKLLLESDLSSADQILQIHAVCHTLDLTIPPEAFETRATAATWLHAHERKLGQRRIHFRVNTPPIPECNEDQP